MASQRPPRDASARASRASETPTSPFHTRPSPPPPFSGPRLTRPVRSKLGRWAGEVGLLGQALWVREPLRALLAAGLLTLCSWGPKTLQTVRGTLCWPGSEHPSLSDRREEKAGEKRRGSLLPPAPERQRLSK